MICNIPQVVCPGAEDLLTDLLTFSFFSSAIQSHPVSDSVNESWSPTAWSKESLPLGPHDSHDLRVPECAGAGACNPKRNGRQSHTNSIQFVLLPSALLQPWKEKEIDRPIKKWNLGRTNLSIFFVHVMHWCIIYPSVDAVDSDAIIHLTLLHPEPMHIIASMMLKTSSYSQYSHTSRIASTKVVGNAG